MELQLVSVITPAFNAEAFVAETIESVLAQTHTYWEMILVDDNSTDSTFSIFKKYAAQDSRIKIFRFNENKGAGSCRNEAIKMAKGEFIAFLDADDLWKPDKLKVQLDFMKQKNIPLCFSSYQLMDEDGNPQRFIVEALPILTFRKLMKSNYIGNLTGIYSVAKLGKVYAPTVRKRQDWALWLKILQRTKKAHGIQQSLAFYRLRKGSISGNKFGMLRYNYLIFRNELNFSTVKSILKMGVFLKEHFFVKRKQVKKLK